LAALGAIITIFALALDPFFQQVIDFPDRWISSGQESSVPIVRVYDSADVVMFQNGKRSAVQEAPIKIVADKFVTGNGSQPIQFGGVTKPEIPVFCPTSNCTWPAYESLGVCSSCTDVSDMLTFGCLYTRVDWVRNLTGGSESVPKYPNGTQCGYFLNITSARPILMSGYLVDSVQSEAGGGDAGEALLMRALPLISNPSRFPLYGDGSINFKNIQNKLQNGIIASIPDGLIENVYQNKSPVAQECVLAWCVKKIESSWYSGSYEEKVIDTYFNETKSGYPWLLDSDGRATAYPGNSTILAPAGNGSAIYGLSNNTSVGTVNVFDDLFPSFYTTKNASDKPTLRLSTNALIPRWRTLEFNPWVSPNNVTRHLERLCAAITDALRNSNSKEMFLGQAWVVEPYVAVRWQFLSLPILLLVFCTIFLATTIYSNSSPQDVWKNSAVAILIHGLPDNIQKKIRSSTTHMGITQTKTKDLKVELQSKGWRASGFFPMTPRQDWNRPPPGWI
jgi:hypothetical protein